MNSTEKEYPKISIVTPSYNQGSYLEETILSVLNQKYPNLEYIIIDGGSTDTSLEIIKKYASHLSYWVSEKDSGQSDALNKGFNRASGEIIAWLNSDDLYCENALHAIAEKFMEHPQVGVVYGDVINFSANGKETRITNQFDLLDFFSRVSIHQPGVFWRKSLLTERNPLDESLYYCMDYDLWMKLFLNAESLRIDKVLARFREHADSKTHSRPLKLYAEYQKIVCRFFHSLPDKHWKERLISSGIEHDSGVKTYALKNTYPDSTLHKLFKIYRCTCLEIEYTKRDIKKMNTLFLLNPSLFFRSKGLLFFLKLNSGIVFLKDKIRAKN